LRPKRSLPRASKEGGPIEPSRTLRGSTLVELGIERPQASIAMLGLLFLIATLCSVSPSRFCSLRTNATSGSW